MNVIKANHRELNIKWLNNLGWNWRTSVFSNNTEQWQEAMFTGTDVLYIKDMKYNSIAKLVLKGGCTQNGTPAPTSVIDIVTNKGALKYGALGKNLLNVNNVTIVVGKYINNTGVATGAAANTYFDVFVPVKPGTPYTLKTSVSLNYSNFMEYDETFTFIKRTLYGEGATNPAGYTTTHVMGDTTKYVKVGSNISGATLTVDDVLAIKWMFSEGDTELPYEEYQGGVYTTGSDSIRIGSKNLNAGTLGYQGYTSTGGTSTSTTFCGTLHKIKVSAGQKYTVSFGGLPDGANGVFVNTWNVDGSWNMRQAISSNSKLTYTIPEGIGEVNFTIYKTGGITIDGNSWMQVEYGDTATSYQPYAEYGTTNAEMLLSVDTYIDTQDIVSGVITRKVGVKVFDGTENMSLSSGTYNFGIQDKIKTGTSLWCSHYPYTSASASVADDKTIKSYSSVNIGFKDADYTTTDEFEAFLQNQYKQGTPVIVVYPLANQIIEQTTTKVMYNGKGDNTMFRKAYINDLGLEVTCFVAK